MSDHNLEPFLAPTPRQPTLASVALGILVGCCLCASLLASVL